jgi:ATP/maltotriose-dependent transcriptional regulator MalT
LLKLDEAAAALAEAETLAIPERLFLRTALMYSMARLNHVQGDLEQAAQAYGDLRNTHRSLGNHTEAAQHGSNLAEIEHALGHTERAVAIVQEELPRLRAGRNSWYLLMVLSNLAGYLVSLNWIEESRTTAREALRVGSTHDPDNYNVTYAIEHLALGLGLDGSISRAAQLAGYTEAALNRMGFYDREFTERRTRTRLETVLRERLAPAELAELIARGEALTADDAIALGLQDDP